MLIAQLRMRNIQNIPYIFSICEVPEVLKLGKKNGQNLFFTPFYQFSISHCIGLVGRGTGAIPCRWGMVRNFLVNRLLVDLTACSEQQNAFAFSLSAMPLRSMMQKNVSLGVSANDWLLSSSASSASILGMMLATATCSLLPNWLMLPLCRVASSTSMPSLICATDS